MGPSSGQSTGHSRGNSRQHAPPSTYPSGAACPPSSGRQARGMKALPRRHRCSTLPSFGEPLIVDSSACPPRPVVTPPEAPFAPASRRGRSSEVIIGHQRSSEAIRGHQRSSEVIRGHQRPSEAIRGHQRPSEVIRGSSCTCVSSSFVSVRIAPFAVLHKAFPLAQPSP